MESRIKGVSILRAALVLAAAVAQVAFAFAPDLLGFGRTIGERSREFQTLLVPAGLVFVIWLPLYAGSIAFAVFHALPAQLRDPLFRQVGWLAFFSYAANAAWAVHQPLFGPGWVSFLLILAIVAPLLLAIRSIRNTNPQPFLRSLALSPLFGLAGWITLASPVAFSLALRSSGLEPSGLTDVELSLLILTGWSVVAVFLVWRARSLVFVTAILWGLSGVALINKARGEDLLVIAALVLAAALLVVAVLSKIFASGNPTVGSSTDD